MQTLRSACAVALTFACALGAALALSNAASAAWDKPWKAETRALVIDAYEFNPIDWQELTKDKRIVGFINKASDGLPPEWNCRGKSGDAELLCKNRWWKYSVTKELYMTRRAMAKALGLEWGAYHLARPGNPREQADHFVDFAEPAADDLIAIDIEDKTSEWMSLADAEIFANQVFIRTGRHPVLYTNGSTAKWISEHRETYRLLSRMPLWYARYRDDITGLFPETTWPSYALWQFSSMHNCSERSCPYRVKGAKTDIDVNVSPLDVAGLKAAWPFDELVTPLEMPASPSLVAGWRDKAGKALASIAGGLALLAEAKPAKTGAPTAAEIATAAKSETIVASNYAPARGSAAAIDPLKLLTEAALAERRDGAARDAIDAGRAKAATLAPPARKTVRTAALGAFEGLGDEMKDVASIATEVRKSGVVELGAKTRLFGEADKSRFREWLKASEAKERLKASGTKAPSLAAPALHVPAYAMSQSPRDGGDRGPRPASLLRDTSFSAGRVPVERRIAEAFQATR